jgi:hypothetical protein
MKTDSPTRTVTLAVPPVVGKAMCCALPASENGLAQGVALGTEGVAAEPPRPWATATLPITTTAATERTRAVRRRVARRDARSRIEENSGCAEGWAAAAAADSSEGRSGMALLGEQRSENFSRS